MTEVTFDAMAGDGGWDELTAALYDVRKRERTGRRYEILPPWDVRHGDLDGAAWVKLAPNDRTTPGTLSDLLCCSAAAVIRHAIVGSLTVHYDDGGWWQGGDATRGSVG